MMLWVSIYKDAERMDTLGDVMLKDFMKWLKLIGCTIQIGFVKRCISAWYVNEVKTACLIYNVLPERQKLDSTKWKN